MKPRNRSREKQFVMSVDKPARIFVRTEIMVGLLLLVGLPLLGVYLAGESIGRYLEFPPTTQYVEHAPFSWMVFVGMAVGLAGIVGWGVWRRQCPEERKQGSGFRVQGVRFPWWGWCGVVLGIGMWILAWTRFTWFASLQMFTFSPLWLAYIVVMNALTYRRSGRCMLIDRSRHMAGLFVLSAGFWWFFEYLNRFVQNWYYAGIGTLTPWEYFVFATLPFSTVLPAVMSTHEWLATFPRLTAGLDGFTVEKTRLGGTPRPTLENELNFGGASRPGEPSSVDGGMNGLTRSRRVAVVALVLAAAGLAGIGIRPDILFPVLWISPLVIIASLQTLAGRETVFGDIARGDWSRLVRLALAALVCGFFWELWNYHSLAKWIYTVPYVNRFKVFEMPILGYAGYLPFGWECAVIAGLLEQWERRRR